MSKDYKRISYQAMDLFQAQEDQAAAAVAPLAVRMRPRSFDEFCGQSHVLGPGKPLRRVLEADRLTSAIFFGPAGTGKTTLAGIIARHTAAAYVELNATSATVKDVREQLQLATGRLAATGQKTILFVDELHRFNKAQQDVLLGDVERGTIVFIGATTENPSFAVNGPLVSRSQLVQFEPLNDEQVTTLLQRAVGDDRGLRGLEITIESDALAHLVARAEGDARRALTALEMAAQVVGRGGTIDLALMAEVVQRKALRYDQDAHYDMASALIKSMRGSDPDAAVYWLARMVEGGEDPRFIARRIAICAAEDIGNADPQALLVANAAFQLTTQIGMPECQLVLSQAVIYLACAPKSAAAARALSKAMADVREGHTIPVPRHLQSGSATGAARLDRGQEYRSPHDSAEGYVEQDYLGVDKTYYEPTDRGFEATLKERLAQLREVGMDRTDG